MNYLIYIFDAKQQLALSHLLENLYRHFLSLELGGFNECGQEETFLKILNLNEAHAKMAESLKEGMGDITDDKKFILTEHAILWIEKSLEVFYTEPILIRKKDAKIVQHSYESLCKTVFDTPKILMTKDEVHMML